MQRFLGAVEARTTMLEKRMDVVERDIKAQLATIDASIQTLRTAIDSSRGGWRAIGWLVGIVSSGVAVWLALHQSGVLH